MIRQLCICAAVAVAAGGTQLASAATWYVAPGGSGNGTSPASPLGNINAAFQLAGQGDVIELAAGTYGEQTINHKAATNSWSQNVTIRPATGANVVLGGTVRVNASRVTFTGMTATAHIFLQSDIGHARVENMQFNRTLFVRTNNVTVANNVFTGGVGVDAIQVGALNATTRSSNIVIEHNIIRDYLNDFSDPQDTVHEDGIQLFDTQNVIIRNNLISNVSNASIITSPGRGLGVANVHIENNFLRRMDPAGNGHGFGTLNLLYSGVENITVINNTVMANLHAANTDELLVRNNIIERIQEMGTLVEHDHNLIGSRASGISLDPSDRQGTLPLLVNFATGDLHIAPNNAINLMFGNPDLAPLYDFDGQLRTGPVWVGADQLYVPEPAGMGVSMLGMGLLMRRVRRGGSRSGAAEKPRAIETPAVQCA